MFLVLYYFISPIIIIIAVRQMESPTKSHEPLDDECDEEVDYDVELYEEYASFLRQNHTGSNHPYDLMALYHMFIAMKRDEIEAEVRKNESESAVNNVGASGVVVGDDRETESADPHIFQKSNKLVQIMMKQIFKNICILCGPKRTKDTD